MKRINLAGLAVVVVLALGAFAVSSASALPEIGRCVAKAAGNYTNSNCTTKAAPKGTGGFEFLKGAAKTGFTVAGGHSVLEGASGANIECETLAATGKLDAAGTAGVIKGVEDVVTTLAGCTIPSLDTCQSKGQAEGVIVTESLEGDLGYLNKSTKSVGLELHPKIVKRVPGPYMKFECARGAVQIVTQSKQANNCIIATMGPVNELSPTAIQQYATLGNGKQEFTFFEATPTKTCQLESAVNGGPRELLGEVQTTTVTYDEPLEIKA
jgi:hypothetical protein